MRGRPLGLMFHSEHGTQYTAEPFRKLLDEFHVIQSFLKKGYPFDNAVCESFFRQLKWKEADRRTYRSKPKLYLAVFEYIEGFYNSHRPHASLGWLTPNQLTLAVNSFAISFSFPVHFLVIGTFAFPLSTVNVACSHTFPYQFTSPPLLSISPYTPPFLPFHHAASLILHGPKNTASTRGYRHGCFSIIQSAVTSSSF